MKSIEKTLCELAEDGNLPVESELKGVWYVFDQRRKQVAILTCRPREKVILPLSAIHEMAEAAKVLCG